MSAQPSHMLTPAWIMAPEQAILIRIDSSRRLWLDLSGIWIPPLVVRICLRP